MTNIPDPIRLPHPHVLLHSDQLRSLRAGLIRSLADIDRRITAVASQSSAAAAIVDDHHGPCPLAPLLDGLEASGAFRILRRLDPVIVDMSAAVRAPGTSVVAIVDVETTGLDHRRDEVIELGLLRFEHINGVVTRVTGQMEALREPAVPISPEITRLTGITPAMVAGRKVDPDAVDDMLAGVDLLIAHNAGFDRPFCEALHPAFAARPWACSVQEVDWAAAGFEGARLGHLLLQAGCFGRAHRALDDCRALLHLLGVERLAGEDGPVPLLRDLVASARQMRRRVYADEARFDRKDLLKARGYRWDPGSSTRRKAWWRDVAEVDFRVEAEFLYREIYRSSIPLRTECLTARDRYRAL